MSELIISTCKPNLPLFQKTSFYSGEFLPRKFVLGGSPPVPMLQTPHMFCLTVNTGFRSNVVLPWGTVLRNRNMTARTPLSCEILLKAVFRLQTSLSGVFECLWVFSDAHCTLRLIGVKSIKKFIIFIGFFSGKIFDAEMSRNTCIVAQKYYFFVLKSSWNTPKKFIILIWFVFEPPSLSVDNSHFVQISRFSVKQVE